MDKPRIGSTDYTYVEYIDEVIGFLHYAFTGKNNDVAICSACNLAGVDTFCHDRVVVKKFLHQLSL